MMSLSYYNKCIVSPFIIVGKKILLPIKNENKTEIIQLEKFQIASLHTPFLCNENI